MNGSIFFKSIASEAGVNGAYHAESMNDAKAFGTDDAKAFDMNDAKAKAFGMKDAKAFAMKYAKSFADGMTDSSLLAHLEAHLQLH